VLTGRYLNRTETGDIFGAEEVRRDQASLWGLLIGYRSNLSRAEIVEIRAADPAAVEIIAWSAGPLFQELGRMKIPFGERRFACDRGTWKMGSTRSRHDWAFAAGQAIGDLRIEKAIDGSLVVKEQLEGVVQYPGGTFGNSPQRFIWGHRWLRFRPELVRARLNVSAASSARRARACRRHRRSRTR